MDRAGRGTLLFGAALVLLGLLPVAAQNSAVGKQATAGSEQVPTFRTQANLVLVDVVVRNKGGPVAGLMASDFHVFEDGKLQNLTVFEEHKSTDALRVASAPALPPHVYSDAPQFAMTSAANVLLLDAMNTPLSDQVYVRTRMVKDLKAIPDGTEIALFKLDRRLHILSGFTTDKEALAKLLLKGPGLPENSPAYDPHFSQAMSQLSNLAAEPGGTTLVQQDMQMEAKQNANFQSNLGAEFTMDAFTQLARYLSTIPGRKNLIWYTARIPFSFPTGSNANPTALGSSTMETADFSGQLQTMLELLALARVAVYPVDSRGLTAHPHDWDHLHMDQVARATGGKAYYNTNAVGEALPEAIANGSDYYTLGYAPSNHDYNGAQRNIVVKMDDNAHYDLEYRRSYFADDPAKQDQLMTGRVNPMIAAMQHGSLELSQVNFDVRVLPEGDPEVQSEPVTPGPAGDMTEKMKHAQRYMVDYWVDPRGLEKTKLPDGRLESRVEVTQVAYDQEGIRENYNDTGMTIDLTPQQETQDLQAGLPLHEQIDLPRGKGYLRVGVRDVTSGRIGTVEIPVTVGKR